MKRTNPSAQWSPYKKVKRIDQGIFVRNFSDLTIFGDLLSVLTRVVKETRKRTSRYSTNFIVQNVDNLYLCFYPICKPRTSDPFVGKYGLHNCDGLTMRGNKIHCEESSSESGSSFGSGSSDSDEEESHDYILLGWAMASWRSGQKAKALEAFQMFVKAPQTRAGDFENVFFNRLSARVGGLYVPFPRDEDLELWEQLEADYETERNYNGRLMSIGWRTEARLMYWNVVQDGSSNLFNQLEKQMTHPRDYAIVYFYLALACDFPILEALSWSWKPCHLGIAIRDKCLTFTKHHTKQIFPNNPHNDCTLVFESHGVDWSAQYEAWPAIFSRNLIHYKGVVFNRLCFED